MTDHEVDPHLAPGDGPYGLADLAAVGLEVSSSSVLTLAKLQAAVAAIEAQPPRQPCRHAVSMAGKRRLEDGGQAWCGWCGELLGPYPAA